MGSIPGAGRSSGEGNGKPLQYSCLENPMDRLKSWTVQRVGHDQSNLVRIMMTRLPPYDRHCIFSLFFLSTLFYSYFFLNLEAEHPTTLGILLVHEYNMSYLGYFLLVLLYVYFSVQFSHSVVSNSLRPHGLRHIRPSYPSSTPEVFSNSCPLSC